MNSDMDEQWKPVVGHEGRYMVSNLGRVLSLPNPKRRVAGLISTYPSTAGYPAVNLWRDNRMKRRCVHALVAEAFIGPRPEGMEVRHLNGDKTDNRLENLTYGTHTENVHDTVRHGRHHQINKTHCPQGHAYAGDNLYVHPSGQRVCKACRKAQRRAWLERRAG